MIFPTIAARLRASRSSAAKSGPKPGTRTPTKTAGKAPAFSARDKKRAAGTKAGFGRKGRTVTNVPGPTRARVQTPRKATTGGGIRGFVSGILSRLRRA